MRTRLGPSWRSVGAVWGHPGKSSGPEHSPKKAQKGPPRGPRSGPQRYHDKGSWYDIVGGPLGLFQAPLFEPFLDLCRGCLKPSEAVFQARGGPQIRPKRVRKRAVTKAPNDIIPKALGMMSLGAFVRGVVSLPVTSSPRGGAMYMNPGRTGAMYMNFWGPAGRRKNKKSCTWVRF